MKKWYAGFALLLLTLQASAQWDTVATGATAAFTGIDFAYRDTGALVGYDSISGDPKIYWTSTQGNSWSASLIDDSVPSQRLRAVQYITGMQACAVGDSGIFLFSASGGFDWGGKNIGTASDLLALHFRSANYGFVAGENGTLRRTIDGGQQWTILSPPTSISIRGIDFISDAEGWITGDGGIIAHTPDSGNTWSLDTTPLFGFFNGRSIDMLSATRGFCVGQYGYALETNDGLHWTLIPSISTTEDLHAVRFANNLGGVIAGENGKLYRSTNGGAGWAEETLSYLHRHYNGIAYSGDTTAFVCATGGKLIRSETNISSVIAAEQTQLALNVYPNPFADQINLVCNLAEQSEVSVELFDLSGKLLRVQREGIQSSGEYRTGFDAQELPAGVYLLRLRAGNAGAMMRVVKL